MKSLIKASTLAVAVALAGAASAADLPSRKGPVDAPMYVPPAFTWTGFYIGANAGYGWGSVRESAPIGFHDTDGFIGGGQIGYNYQVGQVVFGVEADFQGADLSSRVDNVFGDYATTELNWFGTVRGRIGFAIDRFLPYVTAGFAYGNVNTSFQFPRLGASFGKDNTQFGYAVGAGVEYAFTNNFTAKLEYMYVDLDRASIPGLGVKVGTDVSIVRAGLNYKF